MKTLLLAFVALLVSSSAYAQSSDPSPDQSTGPIRVTSGIAGPNTGDTGVDPADDTDTGTIHVTSGI